VRDGKVAEIRFQPCWIGDDSAPRPLSAGDPLFARVRDYLIEVTAAEGLSTSIAVDGDEFLLTPGAQAA
jgi:hypothetical protein